MTVKSVQKRGFFDTPVFDQFPINWEILLYGLLLILAIITRFYDLGTRGMSHDESLHTLYSWNLYIGKGYQHDPLMHGPFLFHINALIYFLFGDNDFTARISTALFGIVLVMLPYWFRPWLGRIGALATSVMILISPGLLYYSRYIRHDMFISVWTVLMFLGFFQYMRNRKNIWMYIAAAAVAMMLSTKEVAFIHGFIGVTFIGVMLMWENIEGSLRRLITIAILSVALLLFVGALVLNMQEGAAAAAEVEEADYTTLRAAMELMVNFTFLLLAALLTQRGADRKHRPVTKVLLYLKEEKLAEVGKAAILGIVLFVLFYTTFFSNIYGLQSGTVGALVYWLKQQEVQRGGQPWYYYLFLVPMYEFLPVLVGLIGGFVYMLRKRIPDHISSFEPESSEEETHPSDGGMFGMFTIYWMLSCFVIYSWAGEKMPWLTIHMTLPLIFIAGHVIQSVVSGFDWAAVRQRGGLIFGTALLLLVPVLGVLAVSQPFRSQSIQSINETIQFIAAGVIVIGLGVILWRFGKQLGASLAKKTAFVTVLLVLSLLTVRFAWFLTYVNYDYVNEILVYAHASPDVKLALNQLEDVSRRTVGDKMVRVAYDNDSTWPLEWYLREYPNRVYYGENPTREALDSPVVIVGSANEEKVKPYLGDNYIRYRYRLVWWPMEDYKNQTLGKLWENYVVGPSLSGEVTEEVAASQQDVVRQNWKNLWNIIFYRHYEDYDLNEWPFVHRFYLYVRKDVANEIWPYQSGPVLLTQTVEEDSYEGKYVELEAVNEWGSSGSEAGRLQAPRNLAVGPEGRIYVADSGNHRIQVFDEENNFLFEWGSEGAEEGQFSEPWGLAVAEDGTVFVADTWNHRIQVFTAEGEFLHTFGSHANVQTAPDTEPGKFWGPRDIVVDTDNSLYVTDTGNKRVQKFTSEGEFLDMWGRGGVIAGSFEEPVGIGIDSQGNIYVADTWNQRIQKFDTTFNPIAEWDVQGWEGTSVVNKPYLTIDSQDRVFISDPENYRIIGYDSEGDAFLIWGQYGQDRASFRLPLGLAVNDEDHILIADSDNHRIMEFEVPTQVNN